jgi:hypothetical protein
LSSPTGTQSAIRQLQFVSPSRREEYVSLLCETTYYGGTLLPHSDDISHVYLAGRKVSNDWQLIQSVRSRCLVTLVERVDLLAQPGLLSGAHLLVLDCSGSPQLVPVVLPRLKEQFPDLCVLLVDGGLSQKEIAAAFKEGVKDYFADPYDVDLLVERMDSLCAQRASA